MINCQQCRVDLAEYALGSIDAAQAGPIAAHLAMCPVCRQELDELRAGWSALPLVLAPIQPRPELFEGVLARIDGKRETAARAPGRRPSRHERILSYVVAACVVIGLTAGLWLLSRPADDGVDEATRAGAESLAQRLGSLQEMERLLASKNVRLVALKPAASADAIHAYVVWDLAARQWHFYASNLAALPAGQEYQVWAANEQGDVVAGPAFKVNDAGLGSAVVDLPQLEIHAPTKAIVTLEPAGGSKKPTGKVYLEAAL